MLVSLILFLSERLRHGLTLTQSCHTLLNPVYWKSATQTCANVQLVCKCVCDLNIMNASTICWEWQWLLLTCIELHDLHAPISCARRLKQEVDQDDMSLVVHEDFPLGSRVRYDKPCFTRYFALPNTLDQLLHQIKHLDRVLFPAGML